MGSVTQVGTATALSGTNRTTSSPVTGIWTTATQVRTAGDLLVACVTAEASTSAAATAQASGTTGWTKQFEAGAGTKCLAAIWTKVATGSDAAPAFTSTLSGTAVMTCTLFELTGQAALPFDASGTTTGTTGTAVSVTTSTAPALTGEFAIGVFCRERAAVSSTITASGTGFTLVTNDGSTSSVGHTGTITASNPSTSGTLTGGIALSGTSSSSVTAGVLMTVEPAPTPVSSTDASTVTDASVKVGPVGTDAVHATEFETKAFPSDTDRVVAGDLSINFLGDYVVARDGGENVTPTGGTTPHDTDVSTAADSGTVIKLSNPDASQALDAGEKVSLPSSDASQAADAGEQIRLSSFDAEVTADAGEHITLGVFSSDVSAEADAGEHVAASLSSADASQALDAGEQVHVSSSDVSSASDGNELVRLTTADVSTVLDAAEQIHVSSADAQATADTASTVKPASADFGSAADAGELLRLSSAEASQAADSGTQVALSSPDASQAAEASGLSASSSDTDACQAAEATVITARVSDTDACVAAENQQVFTGHVVTDTETCQAVDSGFAFISDTDGSAASDAGETVTLPSADACAGSESSWSSHPHDSDTVAATETLAFFAGTLFTSDTDACMAADANLTKFTFFHDAETVTAFDTEHETVEVFTYQPPFRWDGGGFQLVWHVLESTGEALITVWRGPLPGRDVYALAQQLATATEVRHVHDGDSCSATSTQVRPELAVWATARRALDSSLGVAIMGAGRLA